MQIVYRVRNVQGAESASSVKQASLESPLGMEPASAEGRWKTARLKVEYPHPDAARDMARATLVLSRAELPAPVEPTIGQRIAGQFNRLTSQGPNAESKPSGICATSSGPDDEIWVLDFPRQQLDLLIAELENTGFFASQSRPGGEAELAVSVDRDKTEKPWTPEPRLDDLVTRVFREGMLEGFMAVGMIDSAAEDALP